MWQSTERFFRFCRVCGARWMYDPLANAYLGTGHDQTLCRECNEAARLSCYTSDAQREERRKRRIAHFGNDGTVDKAKAAEAITEDRRGSPSSGA